AQEHLDDPDIDILFKEMGRKAMPQRVHGDGLADLRQLGRGMAGAVELPRGQGIDRVLAWEEPGLRPADAPPLPQDVEQHRGEHGMAVSSAARYRTTLLERSGLCLARRGAPSARCRYRRPSATAPPTPEAPRRRRRSAPLYT